MENQLSRHLKKLSLISALRFDEAMSYASYYSSIKRIDKKHFAIICDNRSGSTLLASLLNNHQDIDCADEIFRSSSRSRLSRVLFPHAYMNAQINKSHSKIYGFDFKPRQLMAKISTERFPYEIFRQMHESKWQFIYLKRENLFKQSLSHMLAIKRQHWHDIPDRPVKKTKTYISCNKILKTLEEYHLISQGIELATSDIPHFKVSYEKDLEDMSCQQRTLSNIFDYLQVPNTVVTTNIRKIASRAWFDDVQNADEIVACIKRSRYKHYRGLHKEKSLQALP